MPDITALGEALIDLTQAGSGYLPHPGGAPANLLAMLAKLGHRAAFIGQVGDDPFGELIIQSFERAGIDPSGLVRSASFPTTIALVHLSSGGERSFCFYRQGCADVNLNWRDVRTDLIKGARLFHFGSLSLTEEPVRFAALQALDLAKQEGLSVSFDPNYRAMLWSGPKAAKEAVREVLPLVDLLKVSEEELLLLSGTSEVEAGARRLLAMGPSLILVSRAEKGAFYLTEHHRGHVPAPKVKAVDTTGAGDAFFGAFLSRFLRANVLPRDLSTLDRDQLDQWVRFAVCAGTLSVLSHGGIPSLPEEEAILQRMDAMAR